MKVRWGPCLGKNWKQIQIQAKKPFICLLLLYDTEPSGLCFAGFQNKVQQDSSLSWSVFFNLYLRSTAHNLEKKLCWQILSGEQRTSFGDCRGPRRGWLSCTDDQRACEVKSQFLPDNSYHVHMNFQIRWLFKGDSSPVLKIKANGAHVRVGDHRKFGGTKELMDQKTVIVVLESWGNQSAEGTKQWRRQNNSINWKTRNLICTGKLSVSKYTITKCAFLSFVAYVEIYALFWGPNGPKICGRGTKLI